MSRRLRTAPALLLLAAAAAFPACGGGGGAGSSAPPPAIIQPLAITTTTLPDGVQGTAYNFTITATGGSGARTWSISAGNPPLTLSAATGALSGTPGATGTFNFTVQVTDSGSPAQTATRQLTLRIHAPLTFPGTSLPDATATVPYSAAITASGGLAPYTITVPQPASLPPGLSLSGNTISGTPTTAGDFSFAVNASDSAAPAQSISANFTIRVHSPPLTVATTSLPKATRDQAYSTALVAAGGTPPYTWSLAGGALPAGFSLSSSGNISGTTSATGTFNFRVRVADSGTPAGAAERDLSLEVRDTALGRNDSIAQATPISNGTHRASISPYSDPPGTINPDRDFYKLTAQAGSTVFVETFARRQNPSAPDPAMGSHSPLDTVIEIVNGNGQRFQTCNDRSDDNPGSLPLTPDPTPDGFDDPCMNDDIQLGAINDSRLEFRVPGTAGTTVTFYIHVFDWSGHARPDMVYDLVVSGAN